MHSAQTGPMLRTLEFKFCAQTCAPDARARICPARAPICERAWQRQPARTHSKNTHFYGNASAQKVARLCAQQCAERASNSSAMSGAEAAARSLA